MDILKSREIRERGVRGFTGKGSRLEEGVSGTGRKVASGLQGVK